MDKGYLDRERDQNDGPIGLGEGLDLQCDYFSYTFMYLLKRKEILGDGIDSEPEEIKGSDSELDSDKNKNEQN